MVQLFVALSPKTFNPQQGPVLPERLITLALVTTSISQMMASGNAGMGSSARATLETLEGQLESRLNSLDGGAGLLSCDVDPILESVLALTRSPGNHTIFGEHSIQVLGRCAFDTPPEKPGSRHLAMRGLNNILTLAEPTRQSFVDAGYPAKLIDWMKSTDSTDQFLSSRLLLFCSVGTTLDLTPFFENNNLAEIINANISRDAEDPSEPTPGPATACNTTLNLISTIGATKGYEPQMHRFADALQPILTLLGRAAIPSPPLGLPISLLVSSLLSLPFDGQTVNFHTDKLIDVLDRTLGDRPPAAPTLDPVLSPLMGLLLRASQVNPSGAKERLRARLLPTEADRAQVLGQGDTLPHRLLRLTTEILAPNVKQFTTFLLFELSDQDPKKLIDNVGYGYAAGLLQSMGKEFATAGSGPAAGVGAGGVNPVTGQRLDAETSDAGVGLADMTEEEKEREAERLFVLFERLRATGVVDVENPAARAAQMGHVEELSDDDSGDEK